MLGAIVCGLVLLAISVISISFGQLSPTEMALKHNYLLQTVDEHAYAEAGLYFIGPFCDFIRYPKTIQTIQFDRSHRDLLDGRTSDGLPLTLGVTFQYRLLPDSLYQIYHNFGPDGYLKVYSRMGIHLITEMATKYSAYEMFNDKQRIATDMTIRLNDFFSKHLYSVVETLQINDDELPDAFLESVLRAANTKQNITRTVKVREAARVSMETEVLVALAQANATLAFAEGESNKILAEGRAAAAISKAYVNAESVAYSSVAEKLGLTGNSILNYVWYDSLGGGGVAGGHEFGGQMEVLVGVNPAAYISQEGATAR